LFDFFELQAEVLDGETYFSTLTPRCGFSPRSGRPTVAGRFNARFAGAPIGSWRRVATLEQSSPHVSGCKGLRLKCRYRDASILTARSGR
jgi:hypothetical protein